MNGISAAWREVRVIVAGLAGVGVLAWLLKIRWLALLAAGMLGWVFYFFRNPNRIPAAVGPDWIFAPADGKITHIDWVDEPYFFKGSARRISIFLSLLDVHVQRSPYEGTLEFIHYQPGNFAPAFLSNTRRNEFNLIGLQTPHGPMGVKQIVGVLARRIVCWSAVGDYLATGERFGLIKFGSRVEIYLPPNVEIMSHVGQQVYGGQTVVARWRN